MYLCFTCFTALEPALYSAPCRKLTQSLADDGTSNLLLLEILLETPIVQLPLQKLEEVATGQELN